MADFITAVLLSCKVKRCGKMDHEFLKLTIRHLYNPDGEAGQIRPDNFSCKPEYQVMFLAGLSGKVTTEQWYRARVKLQVRSQSIRQIFTSIHRLIENSGSCKNGENSAIQAT